MSQDLLDGPDVELQRAIDGLAPPYDREQVPASALYRHMKKLGARLRSERHRAAYGNGPERR